MTKNKTVKKVFWIIALPWWFCGIMSIGSFMKGKIVHGSFWSLFTLLFFWIVVTSVPYEVDRGKL